MTTTSPSPFGSLRHSIETAMWLLSVAGYVGIAVFGLSLALTPPPPITVTFGPHNPAVWGIAFPFLLGGGWGAAVRLRRRDLYENAALAAAALGYVAYLVNAVIGLFIAQYPSAAAISNAAVVLSFLGWRFLDLEVFALAAGARRGSVLAWVVQRLHRQT